MKTKEEITGNWLERYTQMELKDFSPYIMLTNFNNYVDMFCKQCGVTVPDYSANMRVVNGGGITMINFGMGSPNAALIMDLLECIKPKACLFLGKCGSIRNAQLGDLVLPLAAIRGEGTSNDYFPPEVPALPAFALQHVIALTLKKHHSNFWSGSVYTTNRRVWEHDEEFRKYLLTTRADAVEMECATLFSVGFYNHIPVGALLMVSDNPMVEEGIKTIKSDKYVNINYAHMHVAMGIEALHEIMHGSSLKHLKFDK